MVAIAGWDIGGANVKVTWLRYENGAAWDVRTVALPYEIWRAKDRLPEVLRGALIRADGSPPQAMALTMTAELSDVFATKREGVLFVLDALGSTFPGCPVHVLGLDGQFTPLELARQHPLDFAAANWLATAKWLGQRYRDCLLLDVGSTTTDIIPILGGQAAATGRTDLARLQAGELIYTGALRTHLAAIVRAVPVAGHPCPVSAEYFAISGDVHLVLGHLAPHDYTCPTPDGRPATVETARNRLARLICADGDQLTSGQIDAMARYIHERQVEQIVEGLAQVLARLDGRRDLPAVVMGLGAFLASEAARRLGLQVLELAREWGEAVSMAAPSCAAACLLAGTLEPAQ